MGKFNWVRDKKPSSNTVQYRIFQMFEDIKEQVIQEVKSAGLFRIHLDKSTDVHSCSQLITLVRYIHGEDLRKNSCFVNHSNYPQKVKIYCIL